MQFSTFLIPVFKTIFKIRVTLVVDSLTALSFLLSLLFQSSSLNLAQLGRIDFATNVYILSDTTIQQNIKPTWVGFNLFDAL